MFCRTHLGFLIVLDLDYLLQLHGHVLGAFDNLEVVLNGGLVALLAKFYILTCMGWLGLFLESNGCLIPLRVNRDNNATIVERSAWLFF